MKLTRRGLLKRVLAAPVAAIGASRMAIRPRGLPHQYDFMRGVPGRLTATEALQQECENIRLGTTKRTLTGSYIWCRYVPGAEGGSQIDRSMP